MVLNNYDNHNIIYMYICIYMFIIHFQSLAEYKPSIIPPWFFYSTIKMYFTENLPIKWLYTNIIKVILITYAKI